jgi:hypothetical protein
VFCKHNSHSPALANLFFPADFNRPHKIKYKNIEDIQDFWHLLPKVHTLVIDRLNRDRRKLIFFLKIFKP